MWNIKVSPLRNITSLNWHRPNVVSHRRRNQRPVWLMRSFILNFCSETRGASEHWHHTYVSSKRDEVGPAAANGEAVVEFLFKQGFTFLQTNTTFRVPTESEPSHMQETGAHQACSDGQSRTTEWWWHPLCSLHTCPDAGRGSCSLAAEICSMVPIL